MPFDYQPVLKGKLVALEPLHSDHYDDLYAVAADPLIWEQHPVKTRCEETGFHDFFRESLASGGALIAIDAETQRVIGSSRFHGYNEERSEVEIGWTFLARSHWGGVYNGEMKQLMLQHAFRFAKWVVFLVGPENLRSQRAVEKIGGIRVGSRPDGDGRDSVVIDSAPHLPRKNDGNMEESMNIRVVHLFEHPECLGAVARWIHEEWWADKPGHTVETMEARLGEAIHPDAIPLSLVALDMGRPVGTVNLVANDNEERPDLTPWLAALLVLPEHRDHGVGSELVRALAGNAGRLGVPKMYLGTDIPQFYSKLGAETHEVFSNEYCIMSITTGV